MPNRVIQGFFIGGAMRPLPALRAASAEARPRHPTGAPSPAFAGRAAPLQARMAPGRPPLVHQGAGHVAQPHGGDGSFEIGPVQLGLARGGGKPLPRAVLAKMEAAFGADFSAVRVHVGPQASRIGAIAFTTGNDLYFAPGRYQPDSVQGQQLIGHELAHVIQQRQGRVRAPGAGMAVVQDRTLEAEADRLGMRAAIQRMPSAPARTAVRPGAPGRPAFARIQRSVSLESYGGGQSKKIFGLPSGWKKTKIKSRRKIDKMFGSGSGLSEGRSYDTQRVKQMLRWISSLVMKKYPDSVEIQSYYNKGVIYISSNLTRVNKKIDAECTKNILAVLGQTHKDAFPKWNEDFQKRVSDHGTKLLSDSIYDDQKEVWEALESSSIVVPLANYETDLHAERRIKEHLQGPLDFNRLGGVKRPCTVCTIALDFASEANSGPLWPSKAATTGYDLADIQEEMIDQEIFSYVTVSKRTGVKTTDYDSDSDSDADDY